MIGIVGASGLIGGELFDQLLNKHMGTLPTFMGHPCEGMTYYDLAQPEEGFFDNCHTVIICGGITDIERCSKERESAYKINVTGTCKLIKELGEKNIKVVFLSSDQVFDGIEGGYAESDMPDPVNVYGQNKWEVEQYIQKHAVDYLIARMSKTYSTKHGISSVYTQVTDQLRSGANVQAAVDQIFNPTDVVWSSEVLLHLLDKEQTGIWHIASDVVKSRYEFSCEVAASLGYVEKHILPVKFEQFGFDEPRGLNSSLNTDKLKRFLKETTN